jgi:CO/xanthine dehydrogenase Mo-binding subunit/aerobic-type carbon monoxide dehydrogenase small subunit (CoxS/CutS family)
MTLILEVNGQARPVQTALTDTLLSVLRDQLQLTAAKRGCNQGVCGACTVLIDGRPQRACLSLAVNCEGAAITTLEGLQRDAALKALQAAFAAAGAVQCGFCTPGILISARWLLARQPRPSVDQIRESLSGNLCRCTGYRKIVDAVATAEREAAVVTAPAGAVGTGLARTDIREKVEGRAQYLADLYRPQMLHGAILGSPHPHARIKSYDIRAALAVPGVHAVLTGDDFGNHRMGAFIKDEHAIAKGKVRYVGEPVAAVAAETEAAAKLAARAIEVEYEELPAVLAPEDALRPGAPIIHEDLAAYFKVFDAGSHDNVCSRTSLRDGDEAAWAQCDVIVEGNFTTQPQAHVSLEPCGALAEPDPSGRITLWSANQSVFRVQANVCESLGLPMAQLRCLTPRIGAGFGNKMEPHIQPIAVKLALATGRPVKLVLSREEDFEIVRARHPFRTRIKTGARRDGTLVAREVEVLLDGGAYADDSPGVLGYSLLMSCGPYRFACRKASGTLVYTNKLRFGAFRGFGNPQVSFASEQQLDQIAERLGLDALELRANNMLRPGDRWFGGAEVASNGLPECIERVKAASGWRKGLDVQPSSPGRRRSLGAACTAHISGLLATGAIVRMLEDGTIVLNTGAVDIGQGSDTALTQICAEALKLPVQCVRLANPDTDGSPYNWGTTASRVTYTTGRAVVAAARDVERQIKQHASEMLECDVIDLELRPGGKVGLVGVPDKVVSFFEVSARAHWARGGPIIGTNSFVFDRRSFDPKRAVAIGLPFPQIGVFSFGALVVDVEIDDVTGKVEVKRAWSAVDVGRAINPLAVEGQIEGAFVQGMGFALSEEMVWDGARLANPSLMDYKVPTALDAPYEIHPIIVEAPEPDGPFGAKGVGEIGINAVPAAIANAAAAATGIRFNALPLTPERVLRAMLEQ